MQELIDILRNKELTISCAESLTAGLFASTMGEYSGVSKVFKGGVVSYWNEIKQSVLNVPESVILSSGVVSSECASYMARGVKELFNTDVSVSFTGNAGPEAMEGKPVGLVYIGLCINQTTFSFEYYFKGTRNEIRKQCVIEATKKLIELL